MPAGGVPGRLWHWLLDVGLTALQVKMLEALRMLQEDGVLAAEQSAVALPGLLQLLDTVGLPGSSVGRLLFLRRASALSIPWSRLARKLGGKKTPVPLRPVSHVATAMHAKVVSLLLGMMSKETSQEGAQLWLEQCCSPGCGTYPPGKVASRQHHASKRCRRLHGMW